MNNRRLGWGGLGEIPQASTKSDSCARLSSWRGVEGHQSSLYHAPLRPAGEVTRLSARPADQAPTKTDPCRLTVVELFRRSSSYSQYTRRPDAAAAFACGGRRSDVRQNALFWEEQHQGRSARALSYHGFRIRFAVHLASAVVHLASRIPRHANRTEARTPRERGGTALGNRIDVLDRGRRALVARHPRPPRGRSGAARGPRLHVRALPSR